MFDFKSQSNQKNEKPQPKESVVGIKKDELGKGKDVKQFNVANAKIYTMPQKFIGSGKGKSQFTGKTGKTSGFRKNILIGVVVGVVVIGVLILGSWFLLQSISTPESENLLINQQEQSQTEKTQEEKEEFATLLPTEECSAENCELCDIEECGQFKETCHLEDLCLVDERYEVCPHYICQSGIAEDIGELEDEVMKQELILSKDSDFDLLTDIEEGLWGTDPLLVDTDADGYNDGMEIENLYNPNLPDNKLIDSELIKNFSNSEYGYSVYYPSSWQVGDDLSDQIMFISNTSEFIQIIAEENYMGYLTVQEWYKTQNPGVNENDLEEILIGNWLGIKSPDSLNAYLLNNNYIYIISMNIGLKTELNYSTTFDMILKSFRLFENPM